VVTGGGRGIGKRLAIGFASAGAHVAIIARSRAELDLTKLEIEHAGGSAARFEGDVRDREFVTEAVNRATAHFGKPVGVLICAAGIQGPIGPITEADPQKWWDVLDVNLRGTFHAVRAALPGMIEARCGKILAISGGGAAKPRPFFTAYAASKAALVRMMESLADEVRDHNVQVNCMSPGGTYTAMTDEILRAGERAGWRDLEVARQVQMTGGVAPQRQLKLAMFLSSPKSNHISGRMIHVEDDWERLADVTLTPEAYTLRRMQKG
jgi:3-oxoacyl-[acyl-carrier protein] reductase